MGVSVGSVSSYVQSFFGAGSCRMRSPGELQKSSEVESGDDIG